MKKIKELNLAEVQKTYDYDYDYGIPASAETIQRLQEGLDDAKAGRVSPLVLSPEDVQHINTTVVVESGTRRCIKLKNWREIRIYGAYDAAKIDELQILMPFDEVEKLYLFIKHLEENKDP